MNKLMIAAASLMIATSAQANQPEYTVDADMTPIVEAQKPILVAKHDSRFANYELENFGCCGGR